MKKMSSMLENIRIWYILDFFFLLFLILNYFLQVNFSFYVINIIILIAAIVWSFYRFLLSASADHSACWHAIIHPSYSSLPRPFFRYSPVLSGRCDDSGQDRVLLDSLRLLLLYHPFGIFTISFINFLSPIPGGDLADKF